MKTIRLPDGTSVRGLGRLETRFLYQEIFVERIYGGHEVTRGGCVVDVEGAELQVLQGLRSEHWPRLGAVTAEVEDVDDSLETLCRLLETNGLQTHIRQPAELAGTPYHLLTAVR